MWFAKLLRLRDKMTAKRKKLSYDEEKPFLEHLEDLRKTLTRIIVTLLIAMTASMIWYQDFLQVVKWPAKSAGLDIVEDRSKPEVFDFDSWERVKQIARSLQGLNEVERQAFAEQESALIQQELAKQLAGRSESEQAKLREEAENADPVRYAKALLLYHASWHFCKTLNDKGEKITPGDEEKARRDAFIAKAAGSDAKLKDTAQLLADRGARPDLDPAKPAIELVWRKPAESFFTAVKLSLYAGLIVSFPLVFFFLMEFILPGLTQKEKRLLWPALTIGFGLFLLGVAFAFYFVVPRTLQFFHEFSGGIEGTRDLWTFADYTSFVTMFTLVFGLSFELPVVVLALVKLGLLSSDFMRRTRTWAIVIITVIAAVITPTGDPGTLAALAVPMILMYEACIWIARGMERKERERDAAEAKERAARRSAYTVQPAIGTASVARGEDNDSEHHQSTEPTDATTAEASADSQHRDESASGESLHPEIHPYDPHQDPFHESDQDHDAWLKEQEEIYRREHAHLFPSESPPDAPSTDSPPAQPESNADDAAEPPPGDPGEQSPGGHRHD
ncbi:MAG: twin-arginine translocase subunit TatC [Verrucomicrobiales bacterium]|nr:twin-arginine translocase subunit TatC [Verrucomicrobiales bacterium]